MDHKQYSRRIRHLLSAPFIFVTVIPLVILDIFIEIYQNVVFRLYMLPLVKRSDYIKIDRHKLEYLNFLQKIFCTYCGYANGLLHYSCVIAGTTEKYWCGIRHQESPGFVPPPHHKDFLAYGDKAGFDSIKKKKCK